MIHVSEKTGKYIGIQQGFLDLTRHGASAILSYMDTEGNAAADALLKKKPLSKRESYHLLQDGTAKLLLRTDGDAVTVERVE